MLKHLYNTFIIALLSGSLVMLQTNVAFAAVTETAAQNTTDASGNITNKKSYHFDGVKDFDMLASLGMLGGGFVAGRMLATYKPLTTDVMIAGAGGAAFIAGEIMTNMKFKGTIDEMTIEVEKKTDGTVNEEQIKRLEDLKKSYVEARKTTNTKKTLQMGAAVAFAAGAAMAGYINYQESAGMAKCINAMATAEKTVCVPDVSYKGAVTTLETVRKKPGPSGVKEAQSAPVVAALTKGYVCAPQTPTQASLVAGAMTAIKAACDTTIAKIRKNAVFSYNLGNLTSQIPNHFFNPGLMSNFSTTHNSQKKSFFDMALNLFIAKVDASLIPLLGLSAGVAAGFFAITGTTAKALDLFIYSPFNRMIIFGSLGGVALLASKSSGNIIKKLDANIEAIDKILQDMNKLAKGTKASNLTNEAYQIRTVDPVTFETVPLTSSSSVKTPCMTNNNTENCPSLTNQMKEMPGFSDLPDSFKDIASQSTTMADGLSGTSSISGSTLGTAASLGDKANAVGKILKGRQDAYEKLTNSPGSIKKAEDDFQKKLLDGVKNELRKQGMTATGMMASMGASPINTSLAGSAATDDLKKTPAAPAAVVDIAAKGGKEKDQSLNLDFKDSPAENFAGIGSSGKQPEYDIPTNEISDDSGPTIFELISSRYIKSGYPKLLEEEPAKK